MESPPWYTLDLHGPRTEALSRRHPWADLSLDVSRLTLTTCSVCGHSRYDPTRPHRVAWTSNRPRANFTPVTEGYCFVQDHVRRDLANAGLRGFQFLPVILEVRELDTTADACEVRIIASVPPELENTLWELSASPEVKLYPGSGFVCDACGRRTGASRAGEALRLDLSRWQGEDSVLLAGEESILVTERFLQFARQRSYTGVAFRPLDELGRRVSDDDMRATILNALETFSCAPSNNQATRKSAPVAITPEYLSSTPDPVVLDELYDFVVEYAQSRGCYREGGDDEYEVVIALPPGLRAVYTISSVEFEIPNGGFDQFFYNPSGRFARETAEDLRFAGCHKRPAILERTIAIYEEQCGRPRDYTERWSGEDCASPELDVLFNAYCTLIDQGLDDPWPGLVRRIREQPELFAFDPAAPEQ